MLVLWLECVPLRGREGGIEGEERGGERGGGGGGGSLTSL